MKKIFFLMAISVSFLFSAINLQTATKKELMCIKGIGEKKANAILEYRKKNKIKSADDLIDIKGFGKVLIENVKKDVKSVACGGKKSDTQKKAKTTTKKVTKKESSSKKSESKSKANAKKTTLDKKSPSKSKKEQSSKKNETKVKEKSIKKETKNKKEK